MVGKVVIISKGHLWIINFNQRFQRPNLMGKIVSVIRLDIQL